MKAPFIVFALPRSRTAWVAYYLAQNKRLVGHDIGIWCKNPEDFFANFEAGMVGTVETGAMIGWGLIKERLPHARFAVIRRPVDGVKRSLGQFGIIPNAGEMEARDRMLDEISAYPGVLSVTFSGMYEAQARGALYEHCLQEPYDGLWDAEIAGRNIQIDVFERMRRLAENQVGIAELKASLA